MNQRDGNQSPLYEETKGEPVVTSSNNPFRMLNKKDKDTQQVVGSNLDVKRVKYSYKQTSPGDEKFSPEQDDFKKETGARVATSTASPFQPPSNSGSLRTSKGGRRAGPQVERTR